MAEKIILGLCTSGSRLKISVSAGGRFWQAQKKEFNQEKVLFALVRRELKKAGARLRGVGTVCAARGPGRFTGLRISLTLAGALKALAGARVYTATLFEILALQAFESAHFRAWAGNCGGARLAVLLHAFRDEYFCQVFNAGPKPPRPEGEPAWLKEEEMKKFLAGLEGPLYVIADSQEAAGVYNLAPAGATRAPEAVSKIIPAYIIKAALAYKNKTLKPLYLKPAKYEMEQKRAGVGALLKIIPIHASTPPRPHASTQFYAYKKSEKRGLPRLRRHRGGASRLPGLGSERV